MGLSGGVQNVQIDTLLLRILIVNGARFQGYRMEVLRGRMVAWEPAPQLADLERTGTSLGARAL